MLSSWFPEDVLASAPEPSGAEDVSAFEELIELSQEDDFDTQLAILADGLEDTRDVALEALKRIGQLGQPAAPIVLRVAALLGCVDTKLRSPPSRRLPRSTPQHWGSTWRWRRGVPTTGSLSPRQALWSAGRNRRAGNRIAAVLKVS